MSTSTGASREVRLMALELIAADMIATVYRATSDPVLSIKIKRQRFHWFFEANKIAIGDSILHAAYPEEVQAAVDELLRFAEVLVQQRDLT
jgi:hypothetical protein